jgi:hypothetical protein
MEPIIPLYSQGACIDLDLVKEQATQRAVPSSLQQRRDHLGQYVSHTTVPGTPVKPSDTDATRER